MVRTGQWIVRMALIRWSAHFVAAGQSRTTKAIWMPFRVVGLSPAVAHAGLLVSAWIMRLGNRVGGIFATGENSETTYLLKRSVVATN